MPQTNTYASLDLVIATAVEGKDLDYDQLIMMQDLAFEQGWKQTIEICKIELAELKEAADHEQEMWNDLQYAQTPAGGFLMK